jgi:peptidoglycan/xylan/chitin deacetylase (PgdA/CDA1 family)
VPTVSPETFERQLHLLARFRYHVLSLDAVVGFLDRAGQFPPRSVVLTFDDGYEETHQVAWPLLKRFRFPATVFVTPGEVELPGFLTWQQLAEVAKDGMIIGSHTMHHTYLPLASEDRLLEEIVESKERLEAQTGQPVSYFSYPVGGYTPLIQATVRRAGYRAACTTNRAWDRRAIDPFALRRIKVNERDRASLRFWVKLTGYYDLCRQLEHPA